MALDHNGTPLINGVLHSWASIQVAIQGVPLTGITSIEYEDKQEVVNKYGAGRYPVGRGLGRITPSAKITLYLDEVSALQAKSTTGRLQDLGMFDILVGYLHPTSGLITYDKIRNCHFGDNSRKIKEGDTDIQVELELVPSHIEWGVKA
nr:MAG TPA: putative XkdM-like protein [Caudoviricetes sp.]